LRADGKSSRREKASLLEALRLVILDVGDGDFGDQLVERLRREIPDISLKPIILAQGINANRDVDTDQDEIVDQLAAAGLIIGPWEIATAGGRNGAVSQRIAQAVFSSPAHKLLVPFYNKTWDWAGLDRWDHEAFLRQTVHAVKQILAGEAVKAHRPMGAGSIIAITIAILIVLAGVTSAVINFFGF
jgi:hypothetical protein